LDALIPPLDAAVQVGLPCATLALRLSKKFPETFVPFLKALPAARGSNWAANWRRF